MMQAATSRLRRLNFVHWCGRVVGVVMFIFSLFRVLPLGHRRIWPSGRPGAAVLRLYQVT